MLEAIEIRPLQKYKLMGTGTALDMDGIPAGMPPLYEFRDRKPAIIQFGSLCGQANAAKAMAEFIDAQPCWAPEICMPARPTLCPVCAIKRHIKQLLEPYGLTL